MNAGHANSENNNKIGTILPLSSPAADEGPSPFVQQGVSVKNLAPVLVHFLDDTEHTFHVHRKAKGSMLIELVAAQLDLREKDYFGLAYYDGQKIQHWLYPNKRINKQLKGLLWEFWFQVKFYPPQPSQLSDDLTRYLLYLQLRRDVHTERLPVSFAAQANLGSLVAQAMLGDYQPIGDYASMLNNARIAQPTTEQEQFINHVRDLHKTHRGLTPQEAELNYVNECKSLAMYGVHLFPAKDNRSKPVHIGVSAHGISVYSEQMRIHRFAWAGIIKFSYRRNHFSIKLKAGELDSKKEANVTYDLTSYEHAKLLWKCAVEHHGFFRLLQPEPKHKNSLFGFGSTRFRYTGRTNIQSQMASQLFEAPPITDRVKSKSADQIAQKGPKEHSSPLNYADEATPEKLDNMSSTTAQHLERFGGKSDKKKKEKKHLKKQKVVKKEQIELQPRSASASTSSSSSSSSDAEAEEIHVLVHDEKQQKLPDETIVKEGPELLNKSEPRKTNASLPHASLRTWHEESTGPTEVTTEVDEHGNVVKRTVKTEHIRHTVHTQSYQTMADTGAVISPPPIPSQRRSSSTHSSLPQGNIATNGARQPPVDADDNLGELVSSKAVTSGNRTIETLTYKKEKDGVVETRVEHRITIHANGNIDHDAELNRAILEATKMNPDMKVEKVEVEQSSSGK